MKRFGKMVFAGVILSILAVISAVQRIKKFRKIRQKI